MFAWQVDLRYLEHYPVERTSRQDTLDLVGRFIGWKLERPRWRWQLAITLPIFGVDFSERRRDVTQFMELVIDTAQRITSGMD